MRRGLTLRSYFLLLVGVPLIVLLVAETAVSYRIGINTANQVFDYWLLDSAQTLAEEVRRVDGQLRLVAEGEAIKMFEWDAMDETLFRIATPDGRLIAGNAELPPPGDLVALRLAPRFENRRVAGQPGRSVTFLKAPGTADEVVVQVAETLNKRSNMTTQVLTLVLAKKGAVLAFALFAVAWTIDRGLKPLRTLISELGQRSARDLTPIAIGKAPAELRGLVETMNALLARLERSLTAHEQFIGNIAHQIRTPLAGIKLQAQLAQREAQVPAVRDALAQIERAADHMSHVNSQLLKLARAEVAFGRGPARASSDFVALVRGACEELAPRALARDIELTLDAQPPSLTVAGDPVLLKEMVKNLVDNAIVYGRQHGHIWVLMDVVDGRARFAVEDDGPGIRPEHRPQIFDHFFRPPNSPGGGVGLGLPIVREIALAHGADIRLEDRAAGGGTRFVVEFPPEAVAGTA